MKSVLILGCASLFALATVLPASALMRGNPSNANFKSKHTSGASGAAMQDTTPAQSSKGTASKRKARSN